MIKCPDIANAAEKHVAVIRPYITAFRVPLSHSSNSFAPILQPVIIALACALILEFLLYYMTKPEYQLHVREKIYLDNMLDLF